MPHQIEKAQIAWRCRRGMLELDILLNTFYEDRFDNLSENEQLLFIKLLQQEDQYLYAWILGYQPCPDAALISVIELIRHHARHKN